MPVLVVEPPPNSKSISGEFETFPRKPFYVRPEAVVPRVVTPTRTGLSEAPAAHYLAILQITTTLSWTRPSTHREGLLQRLEQRLAISLERAYSSRYITEKKITNLVAVVGVVAPIAFSSSVRDLMGRDFAPPLLKEMMDAGRFVFIKFPKLQSAPGGSTPASPLQQPIVAVQSPPGDMWSALPVLGCAAASGTGHH